MVAKLWQRCRQSWHEAAPLEATRCKSSTWLLSSAPWFSWKPRIAPSSS